MNKTARVAKALINGDVLTIMDGFKRFGITNLPREISRQIEKKFSVEVSKDRVNFTLEDGLPGWYFRYRLNQTEGNVDGINRMKEYVKEYEPTKRSVQPSETLF
jgi:hypothetical protein